MFASALTAVTVGAALVRASPYAAAWQSTNFTSHVAFGDSYTDDSRLSYFGAHNGSAPPVGWVDPVNYGSADGGRVWAEYVKQYIGTNLYNYAVSGATCSNDIISRVWSTINADFPSVREYEVPAFLADSNYVVNGSNFLDIPVNNTVYSMWIGTNDLGYYAFIEDAQVAGTNISTYVDCVYDQLERLYKRGGRYFVLQNVAPLQLAPIYALPNRGGVGANKYWPQKSGNYTAIHGRMKEQVATVNSIYQYRTPFASLVSGRFPGAHFALMDIYSIFLAIHDNPKQYLNGTAPLNVTGFAEHCNTDFSDCVTSPSPDSFLWFDELHPSEQTERVVAREFINVIKGTSSFATYW